MIDLVNDRQWFKTVFDENYIYIRNYIYYLSGDMVLAEDLVQDVFVQLWEHRARIRHETTRAFLFTVARNGYFKHRRRQTLDLRFKNLFFEQVENQSPEYLLEIREFDEKLQKAISSLPEKCRTIFLLNRIDGMTYREIAESTGVTQKAVEKQMTKAMALLREQIDRKI
jgi:RNA polymerase sigma-70 factor (ECF subfamily)